MQSGPGTGGPRGTVTFLFTDMEGSTRLLQRIGAAFSTVLDAQRLLVRRAFEQFGGHLIDTAGDGQFFVFEGARDALCATVEAQRSLGKHGWPGGADVRVRMGMHTGEPIVSGSGYIGLEVHRAARIAAASHGGQVVLSETTRRLLGHDLPAGIELIDLGEHWLKDLEQPEQLHQVRADGLQAAFPPLRTAGHVLRANLPARALQLIGREEELAALHALLQRDDVRLLTLTGTGGTGKTSLAIEAATRNLHQFRDGVAWVALAPIVDAALVFAAIAQTLAIPVHGEQQILDAVIEKVRARRLLLVLDNFEQVLEAASGIATLVTSCAGLKVLVTSRFALRLSMEREFPVAPLRAPDAEVARTAVAVSAWPAVELFAQRAVAVKPGFRLDDESAAAVAGICRRLDGLPLAIELAAARIKLFSPRALLARLDRGLDLLSSGARDLPARHRTLRLAIGWSYDLLDPGEQAVFRRLAVFAGGCSLESAGTVAVAAGDPGLPALDALTALVDKSLLRQQSAADGEPRFIMLETVREFALEQLAASGDDAATRAAHADLLIALAEAAEPQLTGPGQQEWLPRLGREHDDLRAAYDWTIRTGEATRALRLGAALGRFWIIRGFHTEGRRRLRAALGLPHTAADAPVRTRVLSVAAVLAYEQADLAEAIAYLTEALGHYRETADERRIAETLNHLGWVAFFHADVERAEALTEEALALHERRSDTRGVALSLTNMGAIAMQRGELHRARDLYQRALDLRREQKDARSIAYGACNLGWTLARMGELDGAVALAREAEDVLRALGDRQVLAYACFVLGEVALERGSVADALPVLEEAVALGRDVMQGASLGLAMGVLAEALALNGDAGRAAELAQEAVAHHGRGSTHMWLATSLRCQGEVLRINGRPDAARQSYLQALHISGPRRLRLWAAECIAGMAALAAAAERHDVALRLATASRALRSETGAPVSPRGPDLERIEATAKSLLGDEAAARAMRDGRAVDLLRLESVLD